MARELIPQLASEPSPSALTRLSPSLASALDQCGLMVAYSRDERFDFVNRPSPATLLGLVIHELAEEAARGAWDHCNDDGLATELSGAWDERIAAAYKELVDAHPLGDAPQPEKWRGYQITRVNTLASLTSEVKAGTHGGDGRKQPSQTLTERWLEVEQPPIGGRVDRVEQGPDGVRILDLKTGWTAPDELPKRQREQLLIYAYLWHATTGNWPTSCAIQRLDGSCLELDVQPREVELGVASMVRRFDDYNAAAERDASAAELATPSTDACAYCSYKSLCKPFFASRDGSGSEFRKNVLGTVTSTAGVADGLVVSILVEQGDLPEGEPARLLNIPCGASVVRGDRLACVDLLPTSVPGDLRVGWDSLLCKWV